MYLSYLHVRAVDWSGEGEEHSLFKRKEGHVCSVEYCIHLKELDAFFDLPSGREERGSVAGGSGGHSCRGLILR